MSANIQTYTQTGAGYAQLSNENAEFYQRTMLNKLQNAVVYMPYGKKVTIPKNAGAVTSFRRLEMPTISTTAITEGTTPNGIDLTVNKVSATVAQYGAWTKVSDFLNLAGLDPIITETSGMFGDYAAITMDAIVVNVLKAGTNVQYANGRAGHSTLAAGDIITAAEIQKVRSTMKKNNVPEMTLPNGKKGYLAFAHPDLLTQLFNTAEWKAFNQYNAYNNFQDGVVGNMYGIYFMEARGTVAPTFTDGGSGANLTGYNTIIIGQDAFAVPDIAGSSKPEILVYQNGNTENPLSLYGTIGWKAAFTSVILEQKRLLRLESLLV